MENDQRKAYLRERYKSNRPIVDHKICNICNKDLDSIMFYKHSLYKDGLRPSCKSCFIKKQSKFNKDNPEVVKKAVKKWNKKNPEKIKNIRNDYAARRYRSDPIFKLNKLLRGRLSDALKGRVKKGSAVKDLGCTVQQLKMYIESLWEPGMTWANWSRTGWHVDHIKPMCSFDPTDPEQVKQVCHYTNLRPLWAEDNISKMKQDIKLKISYRK